MHDDELERRLLKLEAQIAELAKTRPTQLIQIETLHMTKPVVEALHFNLGRLDIQDLSGSLNLGNNFGAMPSSGKLLDDEQPNGEHSEEETTDTPQPASSDDEHREPGHWKRTGPGISYVWKE